MDHSPFKRRKLSPTAHVPGDAPTTPGEKSQKGEEERTTPGRASFASPTKASLARYNPTLLSPSKTRSTRSKKGNGESTAAQPPNTNGQRTPTDGNERARSRPGSAQPDRVDPVTSQEAPLQAAPNVSAPRTTRSTAATGLAAAPRRRSSRTPLNEDSPSKRLQSIAQDAENAAAQLKQETAAAARSMEEGPEEVGEDGRNRLPPAHDAPFEATTRQRTDQPRSDVPPTAPPRAPTPPTLQVQRTGLLSSPSKRPKRKQRLLSPFNEPPPKRKPYLPPDPIPEAQKRITRNRPEREPDVEEDSSEKIQLRDKLLAQLCALQAEVEQAERAVAKATQQSLNDETLDSSTTKDLLSLLASTTTSTTPAPPPSKPTTAQTLASFLPFARPIKPYPRSSSPLPTAPSHHPLPSTPLIHLRLFTPLTITSTSSLPTAISQSISITLHAPSHTLTTTLALTVSLATHALTSLTVHHLTPWAEPELGTWIRARAAGTACPAAGHDVAGACWAVGRYWEVALKRALCWRRCARAWGALCVGLEGSGGEGDHDGDDTGEEDSAAEPKEWSRAEITPLLGRDEVVFRAPNRGDDADAGGGGVQVFVRWRVGFDWTGEAESRVEAGVKRVPRSWRDADERASLARIPALFETLVEERGVFGATRVVVGMVFPEMGERGV